MAKSLTIKFLIDNASARAANRQAMADFAAQSKAAEATANAQTRASNRATAVAVAANKRVVDSATQRAAAIDRIENKFLVDDYRRRIKSEQNAIASADRSAAAQARASDRAARAAQRKADMAIVAAKREADRAIKEAQRKADAVARADQRATDMAERRRARAEQQTIASEKRTEKARIDSAWRAFAQKEKAAEKEAEAQLRASNAAKRAAQEQEASQGLAGMATDRLAASVVSLAGSYIGLQGVQYIMEGIAEATHSAAEAQTKLADDLERERDAAREIRSMEGKDANTKGTIEDAKFGVKTGMRMDEVMSYKAAFMGSGAQFEGKTMSGDEFGEFQQNAGRLAVTKGIDPAIVGDLAGKVAGMKDYTKLGDKAGEAALADLNQMIAVLQRGSGNNKQLVEQLSKLSSFAFNEDEMLGAFSSHKEMASALSVAAEVSPQESEVYTRNALKAVRGFGEDDKQAPLLKKAGIDAKTPFFEAFEKLGPIIEKEAKERGLKTYDVIKENFGDEREQKAVGAFINKGVRGGATQDRLDYADKFAAPEAAFDEINKFENDVNSAGPARRAEAEQKRAELEQGAKTIKAETLYKQSEAELRDEGQIDTAGSKIRYFMEDTLSMPGKATGYRGPDARKGEIIGRAALRLEAQAKAMGEKFSSLQLFREYGNDEQALSQHLSMEMERLAKAGVDVYGKPAGPLPSYQQQVEMSAQAPNMGPVVKELKQLNGKIQAQPQAPRPQGKPVGQPRRP